MTCLVLTRAVVFTLWTLDFCEIVGDFLWEVLVNEDNPAWGDRDWGLLWKKLRSNLVEQSRNSDLNLWERRTSLQSSELMPVGLHHPCCHFSFYQSFVSGVCHHA